VTETCDSTNLGGDGILRQCDKKADHKGLHGQTVRLRGSREGEKYASTTNWGDDGLGIHATKGRLIDGKWISDRV